MAPLVALAAVSALLRLAGAFGIAPLRAWSACVRGGLAVMFAITGVSHFTAMSADLVAMVPGWIPEPEVVVTLTGILELLGALGLLNRRLAPWAAAGLTLLLLAMFPANVNAAVIGLDVNGSPATALVPRTLMQLVYLAASGSLVVHYLNDTRRSAVRRSSAAI